MKKTIAILLALLVLLPLAACGGASDPAQRPAGGSSAPDEQPSAELASPQATEAPHALAEDCFFALSGPNSDPRLLFEALASDEAFGGYAARYGDNWRGVATCADAAALTAFIDTLPFPISDEYYFSEMRLLREAGETDCDICYFMHGRDYEGLSGAYVEFSLHPDGEDGSLETLERLVGQGCTEIETAGHPHIRRLYCSNGEFSSFLYFYADIDGQLVGITAFDLSREGAADAILSFDFGTLTEAVNREQFKVY